MQYDSSSEFSALSTDGSLTFDLNNYYTLQMGQMSMSFKATFTGVPSYLDPSRPHDIFDDTSALLTQSSRHGQHVPTDAIV
jgi:hypothetical protein